jgi:hypothetical protein
MGTTFRPVRFLPRLWQALLPLLRAQRLFAHCTFPVPAAWRRPPVGAVIIEAPSRAATGPRNDPSPVPVAQRWPKAHPAARLGWRRDPSRADSAAFRSHAARSGYAASSRTASAMARNRRRPGWRSPAAACLNTHCAICDLLICSLCLGARASHASSSTARKSRTVSGSYAVPFPMRDALHKASPRFILG